MATLSVDGLEFDFSNGWKVTKYDEWAFYRRQFSKMWMGIKALDLLAVDPQGSTLWLLEVKDYRNHQRTKTTELALEVAQKAFDTLAALLPAKANAAEDSEREMAKSSLACKKVRLVLHLEQPIKTSKLRPRAIDPAHVKQDLRRLVKAIDPHPLVVETSRMEGLAWRVD